VTPAEFPQWHGHAHEGASWVIRVFNNLFPRIPETLTGGRNESYIVSRTRVISASIPD